MVNRSRNDLDQLLLWMVPTANYGQLIQIIIPTQKYDKLFHYMVQTVLLFNGLVELSILNLGNPTPIAKYGSSPSLCGPINNWRRVLSANSLCNWTLTTSESKQYFIDWIGRTIHLGNPTPIVRHGSNPSLCGPIDNWRRALSAPQGSSPTDEYASQVTGLSKYRLSTSRESYCFSADSFKSIWASTHWGTY